MDNIMQPQTDQEGFRTEIHNTCNQNLLSTYVLPIDTLKEPALQHGSKQLKFTGEITSLK